jgi:hypothetical protein
MKCEIITTTITTTTRVLPIITGIVFVPSSNLPSFGNHHRHHGHQHQHHHRHHEHHQHYHNTLTIKSSSLSSAVLPSSNQCCHQSVCPFLSLFSWEGHILIPPSTLAFPNPYYITSSSPTSPISPT